mmetsp:Transcript_1542/g.3673  ORF Transcript_1542/g.3673 Transcript_1542/m.3673 type:complete len:258 (-) Transcript_1542:94-867(-)
MMRFKDLALDAQSLAVGPKGGVQVLPLKVEVADTIEEHGHLGVAIAEGGLADAETLLVQLERLLLLSPFLVDLGDSRKDDGNVAMAAGEPSPGDSEELVVKFEGPIVLVLLMERLAGIERRGGVVQTVHPELLAADAECLLVVLESGIELIPLDVDAAHVVERRGAVGMIPAQRPGPDVERAAEQCHGLAGLVGRQVVVKDSEAVERGSDGGGVGTVDDLCVTEGGLVGLDGVGYLSQPVLELSNVLQYRDGEGWHR